MRTLTSDERFRSFQTKIEENVDEYLQLARRDFPFYKHLSENTSLNSSTQTAEFMSEMRSMRRRLEQLTKLILNVESAQSQTSYLPPPDRPSATRARLLEEYMHPKGASPQAQSSSLHDAHIENLGRFQYAKNSHAKEEDAISLDVTPPPGLFIASPNKPKFLHVDQLID